MTDPLDPTGPGPDDDPTLAAAGSRLRAEVGGLSPDAVRAAALGRRSRRLGVVAGAALVAAVAFGGVAVRASLTDDGGSGTPSRAGGLPAGAEVDEVLAGLPDQPIDPTTVKLVSTVSSFDSCGALVDDLRRVGAAHVGSRGFGGFDAMPAGGYAEARAAADVGKAAMTTAAPADGTTLGTNVQVVGVDELDHVKAAGHLIYDLDRTGDLRITDVRSKQVVATLDVTPTDTSSVDQLLVAGGRVAVFGQEVETSEPVEGDPSATRAQTAYLTVALVDATDPAAPVLADRVRVEGRLVAARLVGGEVRLVTTAHMADLGFVLPTTPTSVAKALDANRRAVAGSGAADWIPDWQRDGEQPRPLVPCERVHVPDTFAGVAMTSLVTFPIGERFTPSATSILAPGETLYAGLDRVAISAGVWVDPIDRDRLDFEDWQTAVHELSFEEGAPPAYEGSGIVDGSTVGQFAFGEIGDALAVVSTAGAPWRQADDQRVDLTVLARAGGGRLVERSSVTDLADGRGAVSAVRFVEDRVLVSTGPFGRQVRVIDVDDPAAPRRAGAVNLPGDVGYFHPLPDHRALVIGSRHDVVGSGRNAQDRSWVQADLLDVGDPDAPRVLATWERPWSADQLSWDHHAFTYWPERDLALWGVQDTRWEGGADGRPNHAVVLRTDGGVTEVATPEASKPNEEPPPCATVPITDPEVRQMLGADQQVLRCDDPARRELSWPRYECWKIEAGMVEQVAPGEGAKGSFFACGPAGPPVVSRVLVVDGTPMLLTDQTLETLDPETFASTSITYHPGGLGGGYPL